MQSCYLMPTTLLLLGTGHCHWAHCCTSAPVRGHLVSVVKLAERNTVHCRNWRTEVGWAWTVTGQMVHHHGDSLLSVRLGPVANGHFLPFAYKSWILDGQLWPHRTLLQNTVLLFSTSHSGQHCWDLKHALIYPNSHIWILPEGLCDKCQVIFMTFTISFPG